MTKTITERSRRSRWLLLALFAFLAGGVSPAWGESITESFDEVTATSRYELSNGWGMRHNNGSYQGFGGNYDVQIKSGNYDGNTGKSLYFNYSDDNEYIVIPTTITGEVSFYAKRTTSSGTKTVTFYSVTSDGDSWTIGSQLFNQSLGSSWTKYSFTLEEPTMVAVKLKYAWFDQFTATIYETAEGPALAVKDGSTTLTSPYTYSFGLTTAGTEKTFTLSNPGTAAVEGLSVTDKFGATLSATSIAAGGEATLTITMPDASASEALTISSTTDGIDNFVINVSGTVKDPSKLWCDFTDGLPTGWTNSGSWTIATSGADGTTSGGGYAYNTSYGTNKLMYTPLVTIAEGEKLYLQIKGYGSTASWNKLNIQYSADGTSWTDAKVLNSITNEWQSLEVSEIPAGNWYIGFYGSYVYFTDIYGGTESTAPVITLSQNSYDFELIDTNETSEAITITNTGKSALTGLNITSNNANFTVNCEATKIAADGGTATFTVTMAPNATGAQTATITVKSDNADDLVFTATGAVAKEGTTTAVFNDATLAGWTKAGNTSFNSDETAAYFYYSTNTLASPKVNIASDDFLAVEAKMASSHGYVTVEGSTDGTSFTEIKKLDSNVLNQTDYTTAIVSGISTDYKYLRLNGYYCYVKQVAGLNYAAVLVVKDAEKAAQTSGLTYPFGEVGANQSVSYTFNNAGAGTINITNVVSDNEVFTTNWTESTPAPFTLTITANYDAANAGEQNGTVTVTTSEGDFVINLTSTFLAANAPKILVTPDEAASFGVVTAATSKTYTVKNDGTGTLTVDIASDNDMFTVTAAQLAEIAAGESKTFDVTFTPKAETYGTFNANITVTPTYDTEAAVTINASAKVKDPAIWAEGFTGNALPDGWTVSGNSEKWTFAGGVAKSSYSSTKGYLETPLLTVAASDVLSFQAKSTFNGSVTIKVYKKAGSADWETSAFKTISLTSSDNGVWKDYTIEGLEAGNYKFKFENEDYELDNFEGFKLNANDPKMAVYNDAEATSEVATSTVKDFGWVNATAKETYYMKNGGTGTLTISNIETTEGFMAATDGNAMTVAADADPLALTVTMTAEAIGAKSGTITLTTDGGNFTIPVSGFVYGDKNFIDFTAEGAKMPAGWTGWSIDNNRAESGSSSATMETTTFVVAAGEKLYVEAEGTSSSLWDSKALSYSYSTDNGENWSTAADLVASTTSTVAKQVFTISDIADAEAERNVLIRFTGTYMAITHIYGFTAKAEPIMTTTAADIAFGMQTAESEEQTFTISNEGSATLKDLSVTLGKTNAGDYSITSMKIGDEDFNGTELLAGQTITVKVKQNYDINNLGAKSDVLTISAEGQTTVTINLTGATRDGSKFYADFEDGNMPEGWTKNTWSVTTANGTKVAYAGSTASALISTPMTVAENEALTFKAARQYSYTAPTLQVRYTTDGGVTWSEYTDYAAQVTSSDFASIEVTSVPAGTVVYEIYGRYFYLDEISGFAPTTAPLIAVSTSETLTDDKYDFGQALQAAPADKVFTITNNGNADLVSDIAANDDVEIALSGEDVTINGSQVTVPAGKTATLTVSLKFDAANPGAKSGRVTIDSNDPVADVVLNFTANVLDATAVNIDFANNSKPEGFYSNGWTYSGGYAANSYTTEAEFITSLLTVDDPSDVLSYQARAAYNGNYGQALTVSYSTDRKNWTEIATLGESDLTATFQAFTVSGLKGGEYYLRFAGARVYVDNITGWHFATPVAEHDLYISAANIPTTTLIPATENGVEASAIVNSLRADETGVTAKLFFGETEIATAAAQDITMDGNVTFNFTGNVPAEEGTYAAKVVAYYSDNSVAFETLTTNVEVAHTRTLSITEFTREGEGIVDADENNQFDAAFNVTVQNTGSTAATPVVKIFVGETEVGTATADAEVAAGESEVIAVSVTDASAGEGGELLFTAKAYWTAEGEALATSASNIAIIVNAAAPKFALYEGETAVENNAAVNFGFTETLATKTYIVKNEGNAPLIINSITKPEGFDTYVHPTATETDSEWNLYKKDAGDIITFKATANANVFEADGVEIGESYNFCIHNAEWAETYGWDAAAVSAANTPVSLAAATDENKATGWQELPWATYNVIWDASNHTITFLQTSACYVPANDESTVDVTLRQNEGIKSGDLVINYRVDANTANNFMLAMSGRSLKEGEWYENFAEATAAPIGWEAGDKWTFADGVVKGSWSSGSDNYLTTPTLTVAAGETMSFDYTTTSNYVSIPVSYSKDGGKWTAYAGSLSNLSNGVSGTIEISGLEAGDYRFRFGNDDYNLDNFVGFTLNLADHIMVINESNIPTSSSYSPTMKATQSFEATVTLKESRGIEEANVVAKLYMGEEVIGTAEAVTIEANGTKQITITATPTIAATEGAQMYIEVTYAGGTLKTDAVTRYVTEFVSLALTENENKTIETGYSAVYDQVTLTRNFAKGWNTFVSPVAVTLSDIHAEAVAYNFTGYANGELSFTKVTSTTLNAATPYIIYVPDAIADKVFTWNAPVIYSNYVGAENIKTTQNGATFQGTYAPMAAGDMTGKWGVTSAAKIAKGTAEASMKGFRAYFELPGESARLAFFGEDGTTTFIGTISVEDGNVMIYDLNGRRVETMKRGQLYIKNGKKVMNK